MRRTIAWSGIAFAAILACSPPEDQETGSVRKADFAEAQERLAAEAAAHIDSGNVAFRERDFSRAAAQYRAAARLDDNAAAAWFGIYMAELARGDTAAADAALRHARRIAPGASLIQPAPEQR